MSKNHNDQFELWDLQVEVVGDQNDMVCSHKAGDSFDVVGENISFPAGQNFSLYALASLLPLLPAKQRNTDPSDWMTTDDLVACPDPNCGAEFKITRTRKSNFRHSETTAVKKNASDNE
jgi:uncharacterized repeat protein (TIGR04076 family)